MSTDEINILLLRKQLKPHTKLAANIEESRAMVSQVINYLRSTGPAVRRIRLKIAYRVEKPVQRVFTGAAPATADEIASIAAWADTQSTSRRRSAA